MKNSIYLYCLIPVLIIADALIYKFLIVRKREEIINKNSLAIKLMNRLNASYKFPESNPLNIRRQCATKQSYDRFDPNSCVLDLIRVRGKEWLLRVIEEVENNSSEYNRYLQHYFDIIEANYPAGVLDRLLYKYGINRTEYEKYSSKNWFKKREKRRLRHLKYDTPNDVIIKVDYSYSSPKGRNYYQKLKEYRSPDCRELLKEYENSRRMLTERENQRALMTPKLRYEILKRDGFKCVICGATAKDGEKLVVDHIFPVSKGGKTVPGNLRTLCQTCNAGKGARYDENGLN